RMTVLCEFVINRINHYNGQSVTNISKLTGIVLLVAFALLMSADASAYPAHRCDTCLTSAQFEGVALQNSTGAHSIHYVYSLSNELIFRYEVHRQCAGEQPWANPGGASRQQEQ